MFQLSAVLCSVTSRPRPHTTCPAIVFLISQSDQYPLLWTSLLILVPSLQVARSSSVAQCDTVHSVTPPPPPPPPPIPFVSSLVSIAQVNVIRFQNWCPLQVLVRHPHLMVHLKHSYHLASAFWVWTLLEFGRVREWLIPPVYHTSAEFQSQFLTFLGLTVQTCSVSKLVTNFPDVLVYFRRTQFPGTQYWISLSTPSFVRVRFASQFLIHARCNMFARHAVPKNLTSENDPKYNSLPHFTSSPKCA